MPVLYIRVNSLVIKEWGEKEISTIIENSQVKERIIHTIYIIRGKKVILDFDLANLYGVETKRLNEQVKRNIERFPDDFLFQLTETEFKNLKSQFATSSSGWGGRRKPPNVFTEYGAIQAANVLKSENAIKMSIYIVRAFIHLRELILSNDELSRKIDLLERRIGGHDKLLTRLVKEIKGLIDAPTPKTKRRTIGFILPDNPEQ